MPNDLKAAEAAYRDFLSRRAQAMRRRKRLSAHSQTLLAELTEARSQVEDAALDRNAVLSRAASGDASKEELAAAEERLAAANTDAERQRQLAEAANRELAALAIPTVTEGRLPLAEFGAAAAADLLSSSRMLKSARTALVEAFGLWSAGEDGDWQWFLAQHIPEPDDKELERGHEAFLRLVEPLEKAADKEATP